MQVLCKEGDKFGVGNGVTLEILAITSDRVEVQVITPDGAYVEVISPDQEEAYIEVRHRTEGVCATPPPQQRIVQVNRLTGFSLN